MSGRGVKDKYYNKRCSYYPFPSGNSPSVRSLCQELGTKAKYIFIIILQHPTLITSQSHGGRVLVTLPLCLLGFLLHTWMAAFASKLMWLFEISSVIQFGKFLWTEQML